MRRTGTEKLKLLVILAALLASRQVVAQDDSTTPARTLEIPLVEEMPRIDGRLDDAVWRDAARVTDFIQTEPLAGEPASQPIKRSLP